MTPEDAHDILELRFSESVQERMYDLARRNRSDELSAAGRDELECYVRTGDALSVLHSKARRFLRDMGESDGGGV